MIGAKKYSEAFKAPSWGQRSRNCCSWSIFVTVPLYYTHLAFPPPSLLKLNLKVSKSKRPPFLPPFSRQSEGRALLKILLLKVLSFSSFPLFLPPFFLQSPSEFRSAKSARSNLPNKKPRFFGLWKGRSIYLSFGDRLFYLGNCVRGSSKFLFLFCVNGRCVCLSVFAKDCCVESLWWW